MSFSSVFTPRAKEDLTTSYHHYKEIHLQLGQRFIKEIKIIIGYVEKHPFAFQTRTNSPVRSVPMKKFPFLIHYLPVENLQQIVVLAILNTNESPSKWPVK